MPDTAILLKSTVTFDLKSKRAFEDGVSETLYGVLAEEMTYEDHCARVDSLTDFQGVPLWTSLTGNVGFEPGALSEGLYPFLGALESWAVFARPVISGEAPYVILASDAQPVTAYFFSRGEMVAADVDLEPVRRHDLG